MNYIPRINFILYLGLLFIISNLHAGAQISSPGKPYPLHYKGSAEPLIINIPVTKAQREKAATRDPDLYYLKPATSGLLVDVSFKPDSTGTWDTLEDGTRLWRIALQIDEASSMNIIFSPWKLERGIKVFTYGPDQDIVNGAYSYLNNKSIDMLATSEVAGDLIIVEMQVPAYCKSYGSIGISGIGCDFRKSGFLKSEKDGWFGWSGSCNEDIACTSGQLAKTLKNSVVRIVYKGHERCTGTLVNTTQHDGANYILTAGHCFTKEADANSAVFYFQYESPYCNGPDGNTGKSVSGATIRARSSKVDFALLELFEPIPFSYHPYYAGWDYTGKAPQSGTVIHHPLGDVKKISIENQVLEKSTFGSLYDANTHWLVHHWESGTTEPGSSGAPVFDNFGRIQGTLTGGLATCDNPVEDYFQMFSHSWKDYPSPESQLAIWLDPVNLKAGFLNGSDPYQNFWATGDTLKNISGNESLISGNDDLAWGSYSGHNSLSTSAFAEKFSNSNGRMISGLILDVARNYVSMNSRYLKIKVWSGSDLPGTEIYEQTVYLPDLVENEMNFIRFDTVFAVNNSFFAGYELFYNSPQDTFATYLADHRAGGLNTAYVYDGNDWYSLNDFTAGNINSSFAFYPVVQDSSPVEPRPSDVSEVTAYPNPASSVIRIIFKEILRETVNVSIYNIQGQMVFDQQYQSYQHIIPISLRGISGGMYVIKIRRDNKVNFLKVSIVK